jgi:hypothetical protein
VQETLPRYSLRGIAPTAPDYAEFRRQATCFSQLAAVTGAVATLTGDGQPEDVPALRVTASAFPMLDAVPVVGGLFTTARPMWRRLRQLPVMRLALGACRMPHMSVYIWILGWFAPLLGGRVSM